MLVWEKPGTAAVCALVVYTLLALYHGPLGVSVAPYFAYQADAFLHGQLALRMIPANIHDLVAYQGQYYLYWPPFPAVIFMPFVALFGVGVSDIFIHLLLAAFNVFLAAWLLRRACQREVIRLSAVQRGLLVLLFALGTAYLPVASFGRVWFTGQVVGLMCVLLAYLSALSFRNWKAFFFTGLALAGAMLTRNHLLFTGLWLAWYLVKGHLPARTLTGPQAAASAGEQPGQAGKRRLSRWLPLARYAFLGLLPLAIGGFAFLAYNWVRFGSPTNVGLDYHMMSDTFAADFARYGAFNLHYAPINLYYQYVFYPFPLREETLMGGSLFLLSPVFFAALWALWKGRRQTSTWVLLATILVTNIPIVLLMGTGWIQFGPRYTLDFTVPLLLLTAIGLQDWDTRLVGGLTAVSIFQYLIGALVIAPF